MISRNITIIGAVSLFLASFGMAAADGHGKSTDGTDFRAWLDTASVEAAAVVASSTGVLSSATEPAGGGKADHGNLAAQATNPAAALIQLQLQNVFVPNSHNSSGYANTFIVQPVIPFSLGKDSYFQNLVTRTTIPLVTTPNPDGPIGKTTDLGDTTIIAAPIHKQKVSDTFGYSWGPIGAIQVPTATDDRTGTDKWSIGPGLMVVGSKKNVFTEGDSLQFGGYGYNLWSVAGDGSRMDVNKLFGGPVMTYHFADLFGQKGWYLRWTDELMSFDWNAVFDRDTASVPVGAALGKVFTIGKQPVNVFLGSDYYAAHRGADPVWDIKLNVTLLFPE
jgi:hypothetical protein